MALGNLGKSFMSQDSWVDPTCVYPMINIVSIRNESIGFDGIFMTKKNTMGIDGVAKK